MFIRDLIKCKEITAGDNTILRELFNPEKDDLNLRYSLALAIVKPGKTTLSHRMQSSEVYYIIQGTGKMFIDDEIENVRPGHAIYIPPLSIQKIENNGSDDLIFLCIVDPAWKPEDEEVLNNL
ncbi:MAG: cupin domain-containing protein [candidate division Zixibacteria bacterium]|nr:cupin domain-containing protein [candidate division Zixibacteria bacterium]